MLAKALRQFGLGRMAHNTVLGTFWQFARIAGQALWVIVIARSLGPSGYGTFAGIAGLATTLGGLAGLGTGFLLLQNVSRSHSTFGAHWRKAMLTTLASGLLLAILFSGITHLIVKDHASVAVIAAIGISEVVCYPLVYAAGFAFQAHERLGWSGSLAAMMSGARLFAVIVFWFSATTRDLATYAWFHFAASVLSALYALTLVHVMLRPPRTRFVLRANEVREGLSFSAVWFTGNAVTELDKTLALRLAGSEIAGIYSAAYRLVSVLTLPVASLALAAQPRLFRQDTNQAGGNPHLVRHLALVATAYGLVASVALIFLSGLLPLLLGQAFEPAVRAARLLILVPPLFALRLIGSTVLMTTGRQLTRVLIEVPGIVLLIGLALLWMPKYGLAGIAMTVTTTEALLVVGVWGVLCNAKRKQLQAR
jgi:O-antigen/teichoic acid export membrane protein